MKLRTKGYSYNEIRDTLHIPKSTLSGWFKKMVLSSDAQSRLSRCQGLGTETLIKRNKMQTHRARQHAEKIQSQAESQIPPMDREMLRIIGVVLYWAEGYKRLKVKDGRELTSHVVSFVNSDSAMVRLFVRFSIEILGVPKERIKIAMRLYEHINEELALAYWKEVTGLSSEAFRKTTYLVSIASQRKKPFNRLPFGTVQIEIAQTEKFYQIMGWIEGVKKNM